MDAFDDILRSSDSHEITGLVLRHIRFDRFDDAVHLICLFTDCETADGIAVAVHLNDLLHVFDAEILIGTALIDPEKELMRIERTFLFRKVSKFGLAAQQPARRPVARTLRVTILGWVFDAFVKRHGDR